MQTEHLLFAAHQGSASLFTEAAGEGPFLYLKSDHCLPIACSHTSWASSKQWRAEAGIHACWEDTLDVEEFFGVNGLNLRFGTKEALILKDLSRSGTGPSGLYVYTVTYDPDEAKAQLQDYEESTLNLDATWPWLQAGSLRRPSSEELEPLTRGQAPWGGIVL